MPAMKIGGGKTKALLNIEGMTERSVKELAGAILDILSAPHCDEETKRAALKTLGTLAPNNISISNATFTGPV